MSVLKVGRVMNEWSEMLHDQKGAKFGHNCPYSYVVDEKMKLFSSLRPKQKARFNKMTQTTKLNKAQ